jgi:hypothetical protein
MRYAPTLARAAKRLNFWAIGILSAFAVISIAIWWPSQFFKMGSEGIGEAFEAYHGAMNIMTFGWQWAGLQDMATNPSPAAHPYLYIHHGNLGLYFSYALARLGVASIEAQNAASWFAVLCGLIVAYRLMLSMTSRRELATLFLLLLAFDFNFLEYWAFNIHRAFTYLSLFGTILTYWRARQSRFAAGPMVVFLPATAVLLLADYMFFFFTLIVLGLLTLWYSSLAQWRALLRDEVVLGGTFVAVFLIRQLQVIVGAGPVIWKHDFLYQILNRFHLEYLFRGNWSQATTDFYANNNILNPGFAPAATWSERLVGFVAATGDALLVHVLNLGPSPKLAGAFGALLLVAVIVNGVLISFRQRGPRRDSAAIGASRLGVIFFVGCIAMYALFPRYFLQWYPAFLLAPICVAVWLVALIAPFINRTVGPCQIGVLVLAGAATFKLIAFTPLLMAERPNLNEHAAVLRGLAGEPIASNFTPASVSSYTNAFAGWLKQDAVDKLLTTGRVSTSDYFMLFEADRDNPDYVSPRYFVFFKAYGSPEQLAAIRAQPVADNRVIALFKVPAPR